MVQVSSRAGDVLYQFLRNGTVVLVNITDSDRNKWTEFLAGPIGVVAGIIVGAPGVLNLLIAGYKMQAHIRAYGCRPTVAQTVFWIDIAANLLRCWFVIVSRVRRTKNDFRPTSHLKFLRFLMTCRASSLEFYSYSPLSQVH